LERPVRGEFSGDIDLLVMVASGSTQSSQEADPHSSILKQQLWSPAAFTTIFDCNHFAVSDRALADSHVAHYGFVIEP
jgi:hypothetical protein